MIHKKRFNKLGLFGLKERKNCGGDLFWVLHAFRSLIIYDLINISSVVGEDF